MENGEMSRLGSLSDVNLKLVFTAGSYRIQDLELHTVFFAKISKINNHRL
jgi:hypothetical protein